MLLAGLEIQAYICACFFLRGGMGKSNMTSGDGRSDNHWIFFGRIYPSCAMIISASEAHMMFMCA